MFNIPETITTTTAELPPMLLPDEKRPSLLDEGDTLRVDHPTDPQRWIIGEKLADDVVIASCYAGGELIKTLEFSPSIKADYCLQENLEGWAHLE